VQDYRSIRDWNAVEMNQGERKTYRDTGEADRCARMRGAHDVLPKLSRRICV
jgi:hypothetical protein